MDADQRRTLADLLLHWEDRFAEGVDLSATQLAEEHPQLLAELNRRIQALKATSWLDVSETPSNGTLGSPVTPPTAEPEVLAGRYRLDERIGVGGFAEVWRGFDLQLQRVVAVKVPKAIALASSSAFLDEARRVAAFQHPGIITVHDVGQDGDRWFIVSEFVPGGSLAARLSRGAVPQADAVRWVGDVADALDAAHAAGLVHRDVKPENILIATDGAARLTDFGIAWPQGSAADGRATVGTLRAMAPEQLAGKPVSPASDVYSLGMVLHESLSGGFPFRSSSANGIRGEIANGVVDGVAATIPPRLAAVCRRALAVDPIYRYPTAREFAAAVRDAGKAPSRPGARYLAAVSLAVCLLIALAAAAAIRSRSPAETFTLTSTTAVTPAAHVPLVGLPGDEQRITIRFARIADAAPYVVEAVNMRPYREWQDPPLTYIGPAENGDEARIVYCFTTLRPIHTVRLFGTVFCVDFTIQSGGVGRGAGAVEVSRDGIEWVSIRDALEPVRWGESWKIDETLPRKVVGGTSLWVRVRLLCEGSPNLAYTTAQFGRGFSGSLDGVFGLDITLAD